jgi:hypothetical protein
MMHEIPDDVKRWTARGRNMCRDIKTFFNFGAPVTEHQIRAAACCPT